MSGSRSATMLGFLVVSEGNSGVVLSLKRERKLVDVFVLWSQKGAAKPCGESSA